MTLPIKKKWFEMIYRGEKTEEYREIKPYYTSRFTGFICTGRQILIRLRNGYGKDRPYVDVLCHIYIDYGREDWGAEKDKRYYVLKIDGVIKRYRSNTEENE